MDNSVKAGGFLAKGCGVEDIGLNERNFPPRGRIDVEVGYFMLLRESRNDMAANKTAPACNKNLHAGKSAFWPRAGIVAF